MSYNVSDFNTMTRTINRIQRFDRILIVRTTEKMNAGDTIVIDYNFCHLHKYMETNKILSIDNTTTITLMTGVKISHPNCIVIATMDGMSRKELEPFRNTLFNNRVTALTQTDTSSENVSHRQTQTEDSVDEEDTCSISSILSDSSLKSIASSRTSTCTESSSSCSSSQTSEESSVHQLVINKHKCTPERVGLFSNNFITLK
jgi:hypothetical protein